MTELQQLIDKLESQISNHEKSNTKISESTIGWHIDHSLLVINGIAAQLKKSNPSNYKRKFNLNRLFVQSINKIPRGKGKAPQSVQPKESSSKEILKAKIIEAKNSIIEFGNLDPNSFFAHPYFGDLNLKTTLWFLKIHTKHHLKIIEDITRKA